MPWEEFKVLPVKEFCPNNELQKLEKEFWNHAMVVANHVAYTDRFNELGRLVPHLVTPESNESRGTFMGWFPKPVGWLRQLRATYNSKCHIEVATLTDDAIRNGSLTKGKEEKGWRRTKQAREYQN